MESITKIVSLRGPWRRFGKVNRNSKSSQEQHYQIRLKRSEPKLTGNALD